MKESTKFVVIFFSIVLYYAVDGGAQTTDEIYRKFSKEYHSFGGVTLPFYFFRPAGYDSTKKYPLVFCLHGAGERGDDSTAVERNSMATVWVRDSNQAKWPCFVLVPQCPVNGWWVYTYLSGSSMNYQISPYLLNTVDILDSLSVRYSVDANRIYLTGLSMGGYGTWALLIGFPDRFAAAVPMSGAGDASKAALIKDIPIWDFHGALDNTVPVSGSRDMIHALENAGDEVVYTDCINGDCTGLPDSVVAEKVHGGAKHLYTEYGYGTHAIWDTAYNEPLLLPWVFSQSKANRPSGLCERKNIPEEFTLLQNYPNPFNPTTTINYRLASVSGVDLRVHDILGRDVAILVNETQAAGDHEVVLDASGLASGVYLVVLRANGKSAVQKICLMK